MKCEVCLTEYHPSVTVINGICHCRNCMDKRYPRPERVAPASISKVFLKNYGLVSENRLKELDRRVAIPGTRDENGYSQVGTKLSDGRISDKAVDIGR